MQALGKVSHGLDSDSAVERLQAEQCKSETPFTYPHSLITTAYEAVDHAFREAFSDQRSSNSPELIRQAQQTARECMAEMLQGNEFMRLTADAQQAIEAALKKLAEQVTHEALQLEQVIAKECGKTRLPTQDLRRQMREKFLRQRPVEEFRQRYLGWAASVEKSREAGQQSGKETQ